MTFRALAGLFGLILALMGGAARSQTCDRSGEAWAAPAFANAISVY